MVVSIPFTDVFCQENNRGKSADGISTNRCFEIEVQQLRLNDSRFYHLDTCFCPLEGGYLLYYPPAFDGRANSVIEARVPSDKRFAVSDEDALRFACNAVNIGMTIVLNYATRELEGWLVSRGFEVLQTRVSEFMKAGGSTKCLSLRLNEF